MPFIPVAERELLARGESATTPGQRCYLHYKLMVEKWNNNPRWTTADEIYAWVQDLNQPDADWQRAKELAWQVFFQEYVMAYEQDKKSLNGRV